MREKADPAPWLTNLPDEWLGIRLKHVGRFINGYAFSSTEWSDAGDRIIRIQNLNDQAARYNRFSGQLPPRYRVKSGDVLISWSASLGAFRWSGEPAWLNQHIYRVVPEPSLITNEFLYYLAKWFIEVLESRLHGSAMKHLTKEALLDFWVSLPPLPIQRAIASFLDHETEKIDTLIEKKRRLLDLLEEKRTALITQAVTRGLDPDVQMKDSGVEWLGEISEHWEVVKLAWLVERLDQGWSPVAADRTTNAGEWGVLKLSAVKHGKFVQKEHKTLEQGSKIHEGLPLKNGDVLVTRANTPELVGDACVVQGLQSQLIHSDLIYRLKIRDQLDPAFLTYWLISSPGRRHPRLEARGSSLSMVKLSQGHVRDWPVPLPPIEEQARIADFVGHQEAKLEAVLGRLVEAISLLQEYRTALISAAVTGKIDVRDKVPA
ncbi:MAG: restriction endonuclease subunit S [Dehalococcoidia bacterium]